MSILLLGVFAWSFMKLWKDDCIGSGAGGAYLNSKEQLSCNAERKGGEKKKERNREVLKSVLS